ncbi:MAG: ABC transporter permease subunit [Spirochaetaceae bacterium]|jgi:ABC-type sugar transport system permease subunit|nr:ABC transporter permease subunit [Spirochaetaceae bacterium]
MIKQIFRIAGTVVLCFFGCYFMFRLFRDGFFAFGIFVGAVTCFVTLILLRKSLTAWRWVAAGLVMAVLFTVYPIFYTVYLSFTNMSGGHLLTKAQVIRRLSEEMYSPDEGGSWAYTVYRKGKDFMLLLRHDEGFFTVKPDGVPEERDLQEPPNVIDNFVKLNQAETMQNLQILGKIDFGRPPTVVKVISLQEASVQLPAYSYDDAENTFTDNRTGEVYREAKGTFTSQSGKTLTSGYMVGIGWNNYTRFLGNPGFLKPVLGILIWNTMFSLFSVLASFALGMMIALLFEDLKYRRIIRTLLIVPYPIPVLVSIMVWRGLLNENMGLVTTLITNIFGSSPRFFTDVGWTRFALILINVYLSYPYFYVLASGALKAIPKDLFEAAAIDGASPFSVVIKIILPLVMRILAPLVIASFCFNFNNFTLVWGFNAGLPAMADTAVPMGYTDLLISFIYRLGFSSSNAADYGFSAAITVMLFILVALMVFFQTLNTKTIKES